MIFGVFVATDGTTQEGLCMEYLSNCLLDTIPKNNHLFLPANKRLAFQLTFMPYYL
jgi:hypothetical protein